MQSTCVYEEKKVSANALDFDDIIMQTVFLLRENAEVREYYQEFRVAKEQEQDL